MKKSLVLGLLLTFAFSLAAESLSLKSVCQGLSKHPNTTGDFTQIKTINANGRQLKSYGRFIISPLGIMWKTQKPFPSSIVITEDKMVQTAADGKQSVMSASGNEMFKSIATSLSAVFKGDEKALQANFETALTQDADGNWKLTLKPKDSTIGSVIENMEMNGTASAELVVMNSIEISEGSSNKIKYEFTNQEYPKELTDDEKANFIFK